MLMINNSIPNARMVTEGEYGLRPPFKPHSAYESFKTSVRALQNGYKPNGEAVVKGKRPALKRDYGFLLEPTSLLADDNHFKTLISKRPEGTKLVDDSQLQAMLAPHILTWTVLWWLMDGNLNGKEDGGSDQPPKQGPVTFLPMHLIRDTQSRRTFIDYLTHIGTFDEKTQAFRLTYTTIPPRRDNKNWSGNWVAAMDTLMFVEVEFNAACIPAQCVNDAINNALSFTDVRGGVIQARASVGGERATRANIELIAHIISTAFRHLGNTKQDVTQDAEKNILVEIYKSQSKFDKDHQKLIRRAIAVVMARYYCAITLAGVSVTLKDSTKGSSGTLFPPDVTHPGQPLRDKPSPLPDLNEKQVTVKTIVSGRITPFVARSASVGPA